MTNYYISEDGAGTGVGTSVDNAMAIAVLGYQTYLASPSSGGSGLEYTGGDTLHIMRNSDGTPIELTTTAQVTLSSYQSGTSSAPLYITGCDSSGTIDGVRTKFECTSLSGNWWNLTSDCDYVRFQHLEVDCDGASVDIVESASGATAGEYNTAYNIHGTNGARCITFRGKGAKIHNCYAKDMSEYGFVLTGNGTQIISNCVAIDATDSTGSSNFYISEEAFMVNCYSEGGAGYGVKVAGDNASVISCTINNAGVDGIRSEHHGFTAINNIISNNGAYGIDDNGADDLNISDYNLYYNNTAGSSHRDDIAKGLHDIDDLDPLFADIQDSHVTAYDYSVNNKSPAWRAGTNGDTIGASLRAQHKSSTARYI